MFEEKVQKRCQFKNQKQREKKGNRKRNMQPWERGEMNDIYLKKIISEIIPDCKKMRPV